MDNKIQILAEKIYHDGVEKANHEADQIIAEAQAIKSDLLKRAEDEAERIVSAARNEAAKIKEQSEVDIKNMVTNAQDALLLKITDIVNSDAVTRSVNETFANPEVLYSVVLEMSKQMFAENSNGVEISTSNAEKLTEYFRKEAKGILDKGVQIREVAGKPASFDISPVGADYKVNISKQGFTEYFKEFMRPRMQEILFGNN